MISNFIKLFIPFCLLLSNVKFCLSSSLGTFWHISDIHFDPYYSEQAEDPTKVCPSSFDLPVPNPGPWGDYGCDAPWKLVNSTIHAIKIFKPDPDFIIWTGDHVIHTAEPEKYLSPEKVLEIMTNITVLLKNVFPDTKIFPSPGNHDYFPKTQIPPGNNSIFSAIALLWKDWLSADSYKSFNKNGFYTEQFGDKLQNRLISLDSNLWHAGNKQVSGTGDPGGQFEWLERTLKEARNQLQKVFIIGHVPPGYFERDVNVIWFYEEYNRIFNSIVTSYADVIAGQFFAHQHTGTYHLLKNDDNKVVTSMFLGPSVTPWSDPVYGGGQNPTARLYEYRRDTLLLKDYVQYYMDLEKANKEQGRDPWKIEYRATEAFGIDDVTTPSLEKLTLDMIDGCERSDCPAVFDTMFLYNSASFNLSKCRGVCSRNYLCGVSEVGAKNYKKCIAQWGQKKVPIPGFMVLLIASLVSLVLLSLIALICRIARRRKEDQTTRWGNLYSHLSNNGTHQNQYNM